MSYEVLAQKWRPQSFQDVVGQTHVITTLKNQILSDRVGHAYLFWGPRGTGKTTVARILAKAVNCLNRHQETDFSQELTAEPCNQCQFCIEISQGRSFDVIEMDAASNRGIDPIRGLRENTKLAPLSCRYKIYIIDEAHMLTHEAFNALLKTLEEPPPHVIFILATTERHKVPKTIVSRCQDFDFRYMEQEQISGRLREICDAEGISIDEQAISSIAQQSEGCLRDAENLLERLTASAGKALDLAQIHQILGLGSGHLMNELVDAILKCDLPASLQTLTHLAQQGTDLMQCLQQLIHFFRDLRLLAISLNLEDLIQRPRSDLHWIKEKANLASQERLSRIIKILMRTSGEIKQNGYAQIHLESALIDACSVQEGIQLEKVLKRLSEIEAKIGSGNALEANPPSRISSRPLESGKLSAGSSSSEALEIRRESKSTTNRPPEHSGNRNSPKAVPVEDHPPKKRQTPSDFRSAPSDVQHLIRDSNELAKIWEKLLEALRSEKKMALHGYLVNATLLSDDAARDSSADLALKVACTPASMVTFIEDNEKHLITEILTGLIGYPVQIQFVASNAGSHADTMPSLRKSQQPTPMMLQHEAERDPQLAVALNLFDAKILKIEPQ